MNGLTNTWDLINSDLEQKTKQNSFINSTHFAMDTTCFMLCFSKAFSLIHIEHETQAIKCEFKFTQEWCVSIPLSYPAFLSAHLMQIGFYFGQGHMSCQQTLLTSLCSYHWISRTQRDPEALDPYDLSLFPAPAIILLLQNCCLGSRPENDIIRKWQARS